MSSSSTDRSEVDVMKVPELKPVSEWKKTPVASFTEEEKYISSWDMDTSSALLTGGSEKLIVFWRDRYEELMVQPTDGAPMAATDMRQFRNIVIKSLNMRLLNSKFVLALATESGNTEYNMDGLCTFFDVPNPTNTRNFNEVAAEAVWIKTDLHQMFVQLLAAVMKYLFPSVYKYKEHDGILHDDIMEVIMKKSVSTDNWTGWEDHQLMISKVREMLACMGCQTIVAVHLAETVVHKFRSWWRNACDAEVEKRKKAAEEAAEAKRKSEEEAKRKAEQAQAAAAEFMAKFQQLDPVVRTLVESQFRTTINPALIQALLPQLQQITSPLQQQILSQGSSSSNEINRVPTKGGSSSTDTNEKDGASSSSDITTTKKNANVAQSSSNTPRKETNETDGASSSSTTTTTTTTTTKTNANVEDKEEDAKKSDEEKEIEENGLVIVETPTKEKGTLEEKFPNHREILNGSVKIKMKTYIAFETLRCGKEISGTKFTFEQIDHKDLCVEATLMTKREAVYKSITSLNLKHEQWDSIFSEAAENYDINVEVDEKKDWIDAEKCHVYDLVTFEDPNSSHHGTKFYIVGMDVEALDAELLFVDTPLADNLESISLKVLEKYEGDYPKDPKSTTVGKKHGKTVAVPLKNVDQSNIVSGKRKAPKPDHYVAGSATNGAQKKSKRRIR